jgi:hypothetical protein
MSKKLEIKTGVSYFGFTVIEELNSFRLPCGQVNRAFLCECECGEKSEIRLSNLIRGRNKCQHCEVTPKEHRDLRGRWRRIHLRCNPDYFERHLYFDKGIKVCDEWQNSWESFRDWSLKNGYKKELTIDRINGNKNYSPDNCRWVTQKVNTRNRNVTLMVNYNGESFCLQDLIDIKNIRPHMGTVIARIKNGWSHEKAFDVPFRKGNYNRKREGNWSNKKIKEEDVKEIINLKTGGLKTSEIMKRLDLGVTYQAIDRIIRKYA